MSPAKFSHRFRKEIFREYILKFDEKYNGKNILKHIKKNKSILAISSRLLGAQHTCAVSLPADARCLLLCVAAMLEGACELLSRLYSLKFIAVALYLCGKDYIHLLSTWSVVYLSHGILANLYIVWNSFFLLCS